MQVIHLAHDTTFVTHEPPLATFDELKGRVTRGELEGMLGAVHAMLEKRRFKEKEFRWVLCWLNPGLCLWNAGAVLAARPL